MLLNIHSRKGASLIFAACSSTVEGELIRIQAGLGGYKECFFRQTEIPYIL